MALADYLHDARFSLCLIAGLAAVLAPLLVLWGLKFGLITSMTEELRADPRTRELVPLVQRSFAPGWFEELRGLPWVGYVVPTTRYLAATIRVANARLPMLGTRAAELVPSSEGDPLLEGMARAPSGLDRVVVTTPLAEALNLRPGDTLAATIGRSDPQGSFETVRRELQVIGILPAARSDRLAVLATLEFLAATEAYREGYAVPAFGADGRPRPAGPRTYAAFRLYARSIDDVAPLRDWLGARHVRTDTRLAAIQLVQRLDRRLTTLFAIIAGLAGAGYLLSLAVSLWANTERKRRELSILRLIGLRASSLALLPGIQAAITAVCASLLAGALYWATARVVEGVFQETLGTGQALSRLAPGHYAVALGVTLVLSIAASMAAGLRAASVSPSEGLRDE